LGLAESHQTLVKNKLRDRVVLQTDGQLRTGRDIAIATLLGAEEWGVATAALVVEGCILMRKCHVNTCPVGIATQDPELRSRFSGKPEHVIQFFHFLANDLREIMAELGFRTINEMVGKVEMLKLKKNIQHWKYKHLDLSPILYKEPVDESVGQYKKVAQDHGIADVLDHTLINTAAPALEKKQVVQAQFKIRNIDRATGTMLSYEISKKYKGDGLPEGTIQYTFFGSAGQSFGAFAARGIHFRLEGEANDYFGKGLSGGRLIVVPDKEATFIARENIIIGNVAFYGATAGEAYILGCAGERFAVRNSGVTAVVEGIGDHGCEYMTGGVVVVLGETGENFAAGMSGGVAFVYDKKDTFTQRLNKEMVELETLSGEDIDLLKQLIKNHYHYTHSPFAGKLLDHWQKEYTHFKKVMPSDFKQVLLQRNKKLQLLVTPV
jgi:glutamate synthase (NADPH/NADH) large chain